MGGKKNSIFPNFLFPKMKMKILQKAIFRFRTTETENERQAKTHERL